MRRSCLSLIPLGQPYNATDLIEKIIKIGDKVVYYPMRGYWLDIGKPQDFEKAKIEIINNCKNDPNYIYKIFY